jgi:hypothetical protein
LRKELGYLVGGMIAHGRRRVDVVHIGDMTATAPRLSRRARTWRLRDPSRPGDKGDFNVKLPALAEKTGTIVICARAGFLHCWERLDEDIEALLCGSRQVILVLVVEEFRRLEFATHSYLLTILATAFPSRRFATRLEVYNPSPEPRRLHWPRSPLPWRLLRGRNVTDAAADLEPPTTFSALVLSAQPRAAESTGFT